MNTSTLPTKRKVRFSLTSAEAAASMSQAAITDLQAWILDTLTGKAMTDGELVDTHLHSGLTSKATPQRVRTARRELVDAGLIEWSGSYDLTQFSRKTQIWRAAA